MTFARVFAAMLIALAGSPVASAQDYPSRPIRIIVPFATGGPADIYARFLGQRLQDVLGQPVVVDNRPGAGSIIGTDAVAKAVGCTQVSDILYTPGVSLAGPLPEGFDLATEYMAAVTRRAGDLAAAARVVAFLGAEQTRLERREAGFEPR